MIWIVWLVTFLFPQVSEYGTAKPIAHEVMLSGDYGTPGAIVTQARKECLDLDGCGPR